MQHYTVTIMAGDQPETLTPVLASGDPEIVAVAARAILDRLHLTSPPTGTSDGVAARAGRSQSASEPWSIRLWDCPPGTRLSVRDLAHAVGRPRSWVYRHTSPKGDLAPIPHRRLDGLLVFLAGEIRDWLAANEEVKVPTTRAGRLEAA